MSNRNRTPFKRQYAGENNHSQNGQATQVADHHVEMPNVKPSPTKPVERTFENKEELSVQGQALKTSHLLNLALNRAKADGRGFSIAEQKLRIQIREKISKATDSFTLTEHEVGYLQGLMQVIEFPFESADLIGFVENFGK